MMGAQWWDPLKIKATPHGKAAEWLAADQTGFRKPVTKNQLQSTKLDHFDIDFNKQTVSNELIGFHGTKGKKVFEGSNGSFAID